MGLTQKLGTLPLAILTDASNNVGIGAAPSGTYKLEVTGTAKVSSTLLVSGAATFSSTVNVNGATATTNLNVLGVAGTMVGTTATNQQLRITAPTTTANAGAGIRFDASSGAKEATANIGVVNNATGNTGSLVFNVYNGGADFPEQMRITSAGNVGIGTSSPTQSTLGINRIVEIGGASVPGVILRSTNSTAEFCIGTGGDGFLFSAAGAANAATDNIFRFFTGPTNSSFSATERMRITSGGSVLINQTTDPYNHRLTSNGGTAQGIMASTDSNGNDCVGMWNKATSGNNTFTSFYVGSGVTGVGNIIYNRAGGLTQYNTTSDYRIKSEITDFNGLNIVLNLKPKEFRIRDAENKVIGFIAHELKEYFPQAVIGEKDEVKEDGTPIYQSVDYSQLTGLLVKAIQELNQQNQDLKSRLDKAGL